MSTIILCADDSKTIQTVAEITFRASDFTYVGAMSADEALQKAREQKPALILADAIMPGKTGYDLCKAIKDDPQLADVPVYLLCGNSAAYDAAKGSQAGADGHLSKPWDTQVMLDKVAELVEKSPGAGARPAVSMPSPPVTPPTTQTPPATPAVSRPAPKVAMPPTTLKPPPKVPSPPGLPSSLDADAIASPRAATPPPVVPKPPLLPSTPPGKPVDTQQAVTAARTHTIMGMPTVMPPKPPAQGDKPGRPSDPQLEAKAPAIPAPPNFKPPVATPPASANPALSATAPGIPTRTPATPVAERPAPSLPPKYAPPSKKAAITQPGVPEPPRPAIKPAEPPTSPLGASPLGSSPLGASPLGSSPATPPAAAQTQSAASSAATRVGVPRPPMIKGKPKKRPAFVPPSQVAGASPSVDTRIAAATSAAVNSAALQSGLDPNGPEMRALLALSKDVVERVVWEVVPELAETIIRENLDRLTASRR